MRTTVGNRFCPDTCRRPTPAQAHCTICHRTFGGVTGFDQHRHNGACHNPINLGMIERDGIWRNPMEEHAAERLRKMREQRGKKNEPTVQ